MSKKQLPNEFYTMMEELQTVDFVLVELTLYLDTHPNDYDAINQFNEYSHTRQTLKIKFEELFGPLQQYGNSYSGYPWNWDDPPWPWQI
ncbi:spore coat protein CotJB [Salipaludibacillus neizhouensis]|uniref:Spore coat protein CotJB n=1 Tax=Salipaludibacillus neizhouensis TaxID=885475 RepID=A0A3A9KAS9_9BACI|nr:spore coat protein CotJB [Salipaludibacillus neizhouensis]RKL69249.1 spore coat protein CotJB [Salipaludibacillus neizhouensis]